MSFKQIFFLVPEIALKELNKMVEVNLNKTINFISTTAIPDDPQRFPWVPVGVTITAYIVFFVYLLLAK